METHLRIRTKIKVETLQPGNTFRMIDTIACWMVIDPTKVDMFKEPPQDHHPTKVEAKLLLRDDVVYTVNTENGTMSIIPKNTEVYQVWLRAEEIDGSE
jgi:hypothetical protein